MTPPPPKNDEKRVTFTFVPRTEFQNDETTMLLSLYDFYIAVHSFLAVIFVSEIFVLSNRSIL